MKKLNLKTNDAPHVRGFWSSQKIMFLVIIALLPATFAGIYFFGYDALSVIFVSIAAAWTTDITMQFLTKKGTENRICFINWSSILTGLLLALVLPPKLQLWLPALGSFVAVAIGKYAFGKGNSIFNPALVGRIFLVISFPALMAGWIIPEAINGTGPDAITSATPMTELKLQGHDSLVQSFGSPTNLYNSLAIGNVGGCIGETSAIALLIGAGILLISGIISWRIPLFYIGTVSFISFFSGRDILIDLLGGGLMLGAFFMATDYVTSPATDKGKIIFGIGLGILTMLIRIYSSYPEGVAFSILLMNAAVPLIERYTKPTPYGVSK